MASGGRRFHVRLERGRALPVVVHVPDKHAGWYTHERHESLVSLLPELLPELLPDLHREAKKKGESVRVKEDVFRGAHMELRCFFRSTQPLYHVLVPGAGGASMASADSASAHTLYITASPHP